MADAQADEALSRLDAGDDVPKESNALSALKEVGLVLTNDGRHGGTRANGLPVRSTLTHPRLYSVFDLLVAMRVTDITNVNKTLNKMKSEFTEVSKVQYIFTEPCAGSNRRASSHADARARAARL